ncbi:MAG: hypothetical protein N2450_01755 [bacterium]|nr:hypothetical protein [bacterium]
MSNTLQILIAFFVLLCFIIGCERPKSLEFQTIQKVSITDVRKDTLTFSITVAFFNPNRLGAILRTLDYELKIDHELAGFGSYQENFELPPLKNFTITLPLIVTKSSWEVWKTALLEKDTVQFSIITRGKAKAGWISRNLQSVIKKRIALKSLLNEQFKQEANRFHPKLVAIRLESAGLLKQRLIAEVEYFNPYPFPIEIDSANVSLFINRNFIGQIDFHQTLILYPIQITKATHPIEISTFWASGLLLSNMLNQALEYSLEGVAYLQLETFTLRVPIAFKGIYSP